VRNAGDDPHGGGNHNQEDWHGRRQEEELGVHRKGQDYQAGGNNQNQVNHPITLKLRERLNLAKDKKIVDKREDEGHMAAECASIHEKDSELKMFGFAIPEQGFYSIKILEEGSIQKDVCIVQVLQGRQMRRKSRKSSRT
jgi:hypothetical protein